MQATILPEPPDQLKHLSERLCAVIREEIRQHDMISFARFMELSLYQPGLGYYSAGLHKLGASGDFVTAPEIGTLFAACMARQFVELCDQLERPDILEVGAGTGKFAADLFSSLPGNQWPQRYCILERSADLRAVQADTLSRKVPDALDRVQWLDQPPASDWRGLLIANEVIDALSVERFRINQGEVEQVCIALNNDRFTWAYRPAPPELQRAVRQLGVSFDTGYCSEVLPGLAAWLRTVSEKMQQGLAVFIDYGYPRSEYYLPQRSDGTFMCHYQHRAHDDVFFWPGLQDITAWVDFTALAEAADQCGLDVEGYCTQAMFLLGTGLDQALQHAIASDGGKDDANIAALQAEARQLTLPGMMGEKFQVMGLGRGLDGPLSGFSLQDLRYRL